MINIFVHIHAIEDDRFQKVFASVLLPVVPRIGESIILSGEHKEKLISLIDKKERRNWQDSIDNFKFVEEVSYFSKDKTIHVQLSNNYIN